MLGVFNIMQMHVGLILTLLYFSDELSLLMVKLFFITNLVFQTGTLFLCSLQKTLSRIRGVLKTSHVTKYGPLIGRTSWLMVSERKIGFSEIEKSGKVYFKPT